MGTSCEHRAPGLRYFPFQNYLIFYREIKDGIEIVHVFHGARDIGRLL